jgi:hypothetical protein
MPIPPYKDFESTDDIALAMLYSEPDLVDCSHIGMTLIKDFNTIDAINAA